MEEKTRYIKRLDAGKAPKTTWQRLNDMNCLNYLCFLYQADGNVAKTRLKPMIDFFNGDRILKTAPNSTAMQNDLIYIKEHWTQYRNSQIIKRIAAFVTSCANTTVSETNTDSIFKCISGYYQSDKNNLYFQVEDLLKDLRQGTFADNPALEMQALEEFSLFGAQIQSDAGVQNSGDQNE